MENVHIRNYKGKRIHFIGIGGISMSGLAEILIVQGYHISGSDLLNSAITGKLSHRGATIHLGHHPEQVHGADLIVHTAAVKEDNPEMMEARRLSLPIMDRATLVGQIMEIYPFAIGVSGTHGKTTTTSMLSIIMDQAKLDPTILVGGELDAIGGNVRTGNSQYFITEACEYVESFLKFHPYMALILNIDSDHLDYFRDIDHIYEAFMKYARLVLPQGYLIGCGDDPLVRRLVQDIHCHTVLFGIDTEAEWKASNLEYDELGCATYRAVYHEQDMGWFTLKVPGRHNVYNALAATASAWALGISEDIIKKALLAYTGAHRRFELKGTTHNGVKVLDDYAHHPTEVKATLQAASNLSHEKIWCIFQPHTYTRTKKLFLEFTEAFEGVDTLILADIYAAREKDEGDIHSKDLVRAIASKGQECIYLPSFEAITTYLREQTKTGDIVLTMGAGNIYEVGEQLLFTQV